jgi:hypothetical protein
MRRNRFSEEQIVGILRTLEAIKRVLLRESLNQPHYN